MLFEPLTWGSRPEALCFCPLSRADRVIPYIADFWIQRFESTSIVLSFGRLTMTLNSGVRTHFVEASFRCDDVKVTAVL